MQGIGVLSFCPPAIGEGHISINNHKFYKINRGQFHKIIARKDVLAAMPFTYNNQYRLFFVLTHDSEEYYWSDINEYNEIMKRMESDIDNDDYDPDYYDIYFTQDEAYVAYFRDKTDLDPCDCGSVPLDLICSEVDQDVFKLWDKFKLESLRLLFRIV